MAARRQREEVELKGGESGLGRWLLTYADLITLLMLFFVVMYAMRQTLPHRLLKRFWRGQASHPGAMQPPPGK